MRVIVTILLGLLLHSPAWSAGTKVAAEVPDPEKHLTASDLFDMEFAVNPQVSPDGERVVYVRQFADVMTDRRYSNLWIVNIDGSDHRPLTTGHHGDFSQSWSPDGTRIAFVSDRAGSAQIHMLWMDNGRVAKLTNMRRPPSNLSWSPDGKMLAFNAVVPAPGKPLVEMPPAPKGADWASAPQFIDRLVYRFNNRGYLEPGYTHLFVVPADGGTPRRITKGDFHHDGAPIWSADGRFLIADANLREDWEFEPLDREIWEFSVKDGTARALTDRRGPDTSPAISPDGTKIAYVGFDDHYQGYQITRLYIMNRDGGERRVLSGDFDRSVGSPLWATDGSGIFFRYHDRGNTRIGFYSLNGSRREIARDLGFGWMAYGGGTYTVGGDNVVAYSYSRPHVPCEVAVVERAGDEPRIITAVSEDLLGHKKLGEVEEIWYDSRDGRKIQGWIIKPPEFDSGQRYPLILEIHGGPFANYGDRFDVEKQVWAAMGYVVLYTNPRGSTSYGEEFGNLIHHAYPGNDLHDLLAGVDVVVARGYVDPEQLFVTGGSGGGVLTCWVIGHDTRFRAAVSAYPVINWYSFVLTADIPVFATKYWFPGMPWDHRDHYMDRSLLSVVKNVKTPTMVITGEEDYRTPMSESEQYYTALKLLGVDAMLARYPGEPHGIRRRPSHHVSKVLSIAGWFERYREKEGKPD